MAGGERVGVLAELEWLTQWLSDTTPQGGEAAFETVREAHAAAKELRDAAVRAATVLKASGGPTAQERNEAVARVRAAIRRFDGGSDDGR